MKSHSRQRGDSTSSKSSNYRSRTHNSSAKKWDQAPQASLDASIKTHGNQSSKHDHPGRNSVASKVAARRHHRDKCDTLSEELQTSSEHGRASDSCVTPASHVAKTIPMEVSTRNVPRCKWDTPNEEDHDKSMVDISEQNFDDSLEGEPLTVSFIEKQEELASSELNPSAMEFTPGGIATHVPKPAVDSRPSTTRNSTVMNIKDSTFNDSSNSQFEDSIDSAFDNSVAEEDDLYTQKRSSRHRRSSGRFPSTLNSSQTGWNSFRESYSPRRRNSFNEFDKFELVWRSEKKKGFKIVKEIQEDLFAIGEEYALANCVAADLNMGSGIAVKFRQEFGRVGELMAQNQTQGGLAYLEFDKRFIYYLITKKISNGKPTYETLYRSLVKMRQHMVTNEVKLLAIPRLGCGLDRLEWDKVKVMVEYLFRDTDIEITVCNFQKANESMNLSKERLQNRKCFVDRVSDPIRKARKYSIILYLGTEDGSVDSNLREIDSDFKCLSDYKKATRKLGDTITTIVRNYDYYVVGCIVRSQARDLVDFEMFEKCIKAINKINNRFAKTDEKYSQVSIQYYTDRSDSLLMSKLENILKNTFWDVTIKIHE